MELNMTKSPTRESPPQAKEEPRPRHRNVYDYDGEYEFPVCSIGPRQTFQHGRRDVRFAPHLVGAGEKLRREGEAERLFEIDDQFQPSVPRALYG
jgi:hypothetical protein